MAINRNRPAPFSSRFMKTANAALAGLGKQPTDLDTAFAIPDTAFSPEQKAARTAYTVRLDQSVNGEINKLLDKNKDDPQQLARDLDQSSQALINTLPAPLKPQARQQLGARKQQVLNQAQSQMQTQETVNNNADLAAGMEAYQSAALSSDDPEQHGLENAQKFIGSMMARTDMTDVDKARTQDEFQNLLAETTISKNVQNVLDAEGPDGAASILDSMASDQAILNNPRLGKLTKRLRETVDIEKTRRDVQQFTRTAKEIADRFDNENEAKNYIRTLPDQSNPNLMYALLTKRFDEKREANKQFDQKVWTLLDLTYKGNPQDLFQYIEQGKTPESRKAMLDFALNKITGVEPESNPELYASLFSKRPEELKKLDINLYRNRLNKDEFRNVSDWIKHNEQGPKPWDFALDNMALGDERLAGIEVKTKDGDNIDLGRAMNNLARLKIRNELERQQSEKPDQPLTNAEIKGTIQTLEYRPGNDTAGLGLGGGVGEDVLGQLVQNGDVVFKTVSDANGRDFDQQDGAGLSLPDVDRTNEGLADPAIKKQTQEGSDQNSKTEDEQFLQAKERYNNGEIDNFTRPKYTTLAQSIDDFDQRFKDIPDVSDEQAVNLSKLEKNIADNPENPTKEIVEEIGMTVLGLMPGIGNVISAKEAYDSFQAAKIAAEKGDLSEAGIEAAFTVLGIVGAIPAVGLLARTAAKALRKGRKLIRLGKKIKRLDVSSAVKLSGEELEKFSGVKLNNDVKKLRKAAVDYYNKNLLGTKVKNPDFGEVTFTARGRNKFKATSADAEKIKLLPAVPEMIKKGSIISSEPSKRQGFKAMHWVSSKVEVKGETRDVVISVLEDGNGKFFYNVNRTDSLKRKSLQLSEEQARVEGSSVNDLENRIIDDGSNVNIFFIAPLPLIAGKENKK